MPIANDPSQVFGVVLECDAGKEKPPTFLFRYRSYRDYQIVRQFVEDESNFSIDHAPQIYAMLRKNLAGWQDVVDETGKAVSFDPSAIDTVTNWEDAMDLLYASQRQCRPSVQDLKNSGSPPYSAPAASAQTVPGGGTAPASQAG